MAIEVQCSGCSKRYRVDDKLAGKRLKCKGCGEVLVVPMPDLNDDDNDLSDLTALEGTAQSSDTVAAAAVPAAAGGDEDDPFGQEARQPAYDGPPPTGFLAHFADARRRFEPRPSRHFAYPFAQEIDQWLPWALIVFVALPVLYKGIMHAIETSPMVMLAQIFVLIVAYLLLVVPIALKGIRVAGDGMKFQLPDGAYGKAIAAFSIPIVLGALFLMNWDAAPVGFFLGLPVTFALLWLLFRLQWPEAIAASITSGLFFLAASVGAILITQGVGMGMEMVVSETTEVADQPKPPPPPPIPDVVVPPTDPLATTLPTTGDPTTQTAMNPADPGTSIENPVPTDGVKPNVFETPPGTGDTAVAVSVPPTDPMVPVPPVEKAPEPAGPTIEGPDVGAPNIEKSPIVAKVTSVPGLEKFEEVLYAPRDATRVATVTRTPPNEHAIELWDLKELKSIGKANFRTDQGLRESPVLSPAGEILRVTNWPRLMAQSWSLQQNAVTKQLQLDADQGTPELVAFVNADVLVIKWEKLGEVGLEVWDVKAGKVLRQILIKRTGPNGIAISPDGKTVALVHRTNQNGQPELLLIDVNQPTRRRTFNIAGLDPRWPIDAAGVAFSSDSSRIAVLFERNENLLVSSWTVANGRQQSDHIYGMGQLPVKPNGFTGRAVDWVADDTAWLLYGNAVVDVVTGKLISDLGVDKAVAQRVVDEDTIHVVCKPQAGNDKTLAIIDLNNKKLAELRDQIRKQP